MESLTIGVRRVMGGGAIAHQVCIANVALLLF